MATVKFYLTRPKSDKPTAIFFLMNYGAYTILPDGKKKYLPLKYYTNETILPERWDTKVGAPIAPTARNHRMNAGEYRELKAALDNIEVTAKDVLRRLENDGILPTNELLTKELDKIFKGYKEIEPDRDVKDLLCFVKSFIEKTDKKPNTVKGYKQTAREIEGYIALTGKRLQFENVDLDFYLSFVEYLTNKGYSPNTVGARIKDLKMFMNEAYERNLHTNMDFKKKRFSKPKEETYSVYLNSDELKKIYKCDLSDEPRLDRVRDLFLIGCCTGLRFSDLSLLSSDNVDNVESVITIKTVKTGRTVVIPLHAIVRQILQKYDNELPRVPSNQKFNDYIKEIAKKAEINEPILLQRTKGTLTYAETKPKYDLVTSHTARRSFATNAYLAGLPPISIMKITGHKTESSFMKYIKISEKENAIQLKGHEFFNQIVTC